MHDEYQVARNSTSCAFDLASWMFMLPSSIKGVGEAAGCRPHIAWLI